MANTTITTFINNKKCNYVCIVYKNWMKESQLSNGHFPRRAITSSWQMVFVSAGQFVLRPLFINVSDLRFLRKYQLTASLCVSWPAPLFAQTWPAHTLPLTFNWRWQNTPTEKVVMDDEDKPRCKATGRCNPHLRRCEDGWHARGLNVHFKRK